MKLVAGETVKGPYPFHRWTDGSWEPGRAEDGSFTEGHALLQIVSVASLPKPYVDRVFYVQEMFETPDGEPYLGGARTLRVATLPAFIKSLTTKPRIRPAYGPESGDASRGFRA